MTAVILLVVAAVITSVVLLQKPGDDPGQNGEPKVELEFIPVENETVYAYFDLDGDGYCDSDVKINMRDFPTSDSDVKYILDGGTKMTRIGVYYENGTSGGGWSMVVYNGETLYCRNSCLTTLDPATNRPPINY